MHKSIFLTFYLIMGPMHWEKKKRSKNAYLYSSNGKHIGLTILSVIYLCFLLFYCFLFLFIRREYQIHHLMSKIKLKIKGWGWFYIQKLLYLTWTPHLFYHREGVQSGAHVSRNEQRNSLVPETRWNKGNEHHAPSTRLPENLNTRSENMIRGLK